MGNQEQLIDTRRQSMAKSYGVAGVVSSFLARRMALRGRRLSSDEAELLEQ